MEENQPKTGKFALNFGLLFGLISVVFGVMLYSMDLHYERGMAVQGISFLLMAAAIILGIFQFRNANGGFLSLSEALKIGAGVALIGGIIGIIYFFMLSNYLEPDYMDKMYEIGKQQAMADNPKLTEEQIDQGIEMQKSMSWLFYPIGLIINILAGLFFGLIGGLILKKQKPAY